MLLTRDNLPKTIPDIATLDELLCRPSQALIDDLNKVDGDIMVLGVGGKMGPTLAGLAKAAQPGRKVIGVARFCEPGVKEWLEARGIETINCDLLDERAHQCTAEIAKHHLHGRAQIRSGGQSGADLGDELARAGAGGAGIPGTRASSRSRPAASIPSYPSAARARTKACRPIRPANMRNPASGASACSSISRTSSKRRAGCSA